jgi:hypothetical protein
MSLFLGFTERNNFGRALFPVNPMGAVVNINQLVLDAFFRQFGYPFSAWSCARRLTDLYTGSLIEVRRASDSAVLDIGYNINNELDTAMLLGFIGASSGFVRTLYDQTGAGNHFVQTTASQQPRIVNAGVLDIVNSKPSMFFDGINDNMIVNSSIATYNWMHNLTDANFYQNLNIVAQAGTTANPNASYAFLANNGGTTAKRGFLSSFDDRATALRNNAYFMVTTNGIGGQTVISALYQNELPPNQLVAITDFTYRSNPVALEKHYMQINNGFFNTNTGTNTSSNLDATHDLQLGASGANTAFLLGYISEVIMYRGTNGIVNLNTAIQGNQKDFYSI